jgi:hypothetical protein
MLLFIVICAAAARPSVFNPERVHLIDYSPATQSFLFRGNEPISKNLTFVYDDLLAAFRNASAKVGGPPVPQQIFVVDINLLEVERTSIEIEEKFGLFCLMLFLLLFFLSPKVFQSVPVSWSVSAQTHFRSSLFAH